MTKVLQVVVIAILTFLPNYSHASEVDNKAELSPVYVAVQAEIDERMKLTGTLDIYDKGLNKVRRLKFIDWQGESVVDEARVMVGVFEDKATKEKVEVNLGLEESDGLSVTDVSIGKVHEKEKPDVNKTYTDDEIRQAMTAAVEAKKDDNGHVVLFDMGSQQVLFLELVALGEELRKYGTKFINTAEFQDTKADKKVMVDVTMINKEGELVLDKLKLK